MDPHRATGPPVPGLVSPLSGRIGIIEGMTEGFVALSSEYCYTYVNAAAERIFRTSREELLGQNLWSAFALRGTVAEPAYRRAMEQRVATQFEIFYEPWHRWFEVNVDPATDGGLAVYFRDITQRRKHETILSGQKRALELAVNGAPLTEVLEVLTRSIEQHASDGVMASILLLDPDGIHIRRGAAPSLPEAWTRAIDGLPIGPLAGSCGTAAYTLRRVIVTDIETDPRWEAYRDTARQVALRSCWSTPIMSVRGTVLGTFALYHNHVFEPAPGDFEVVDLLTHTAAVIIERHRETADRLAAEERLALQIQGLERVHSLAQLLARLPGLEPKLEAILSAAAEIHSTDRGILCVFDRAQHVLRVCSSLGFTSDVLKAISVGDFAGAPSRFAFDDRSRVVVSDIETDQRYADFRHVARAAGFRAVHSTPIKTRSGELMGVLTLHFEDRFQPTELQMRLADLCAAHAAEAINAARSEEARRQSDEKLSLLADNMSQFAWIADAHGSIFWYNKRWLDFTATTLEQMQGWGWTAVHHPDHVDRVVKSIQHSWDTGESWEDTFPLRGKDGQYRWFLSRAIPLRDDSGRIVRWFGTNTDITAVRETEMKLEQAKNAAEDANRAKDQFLAMLGHELRNPLAPIVSALELARMRGDGHIGDVGIMERQVEHLVRLVEDILDVARFTRGKVVLTSEHLGLSEVISRAMEMTRPLIQERQHQIEIDVPHEGLDLDGDPVRLAQIAANLISNAAKYTPPEGRIVVEGRLEDGMVVLRISDNGIGLEPGAAEHIFEEFVQETAALNSSRGGLGLGLAIVRKLVELHGGRVEARSEGRGRGSEFIVRLPAAAVHKPAPQSIETPATVAAHPHRVLVVDDNVDAAVLLQSTLKRMGYVVAIAQDGEAALQVAAEFRPAVALIDLNLPKISGFDLPPQIRALPGLHAIRLIAATGHGDDSTRARTAALGFDAHLVKPIGIRTLSRALDELLV